MKYCFLIWVSIIVTNGALHAQLLHGRVLSNENKPIFMVKVAIKNTDIYAYTDVDGTFEFSDIQTEKIFKKSALPYFNLSYNVISIFIPEGKVSLFNINGIKIRESHNGRLDQQFYKSGIYFLNINQNSKLTTVKIVSENGRLYMDPTKVFQLMNYVGVLSKDGFKSMEFIFNPHFQNNLVMDRVDFQPNGYYTHTIENFGEYKTFAGSPLANAYSGVSSVKFIYEIESKTLYYLNSHKVPYHYWFCVNILGYKKLGYFFSLEQYHNNPNRLYYLGSVDYFSAQDLFGISIFPSDDITCEQIQIVYNKLRATSYFRDKISLIPNKSQRAECANVPVVTLCELYEGQNYQCLNAELSFGYLRKVNAGELNQTYAGRHDILLVNGIPNEVPVVSGIITTQFQTVLSHINVLSHNRGTPNMALIDAWDDAYISSLEGKLVKLKTDLDTFELQETTLQEAKAFWEGHEPSSPIVLNPNLSYSFLVSQEDLNYNMVNICGGKAANFGEMAKVYIDGDPIGLPKSAFAIPFYYYDQHIENNGMDSIIDQMLQDETFLSNAQVRADKLKMIRDKIIDAPIDQVFYADLQAKLAKNDFNNFRFRSSTNAEDIEGFNGAGLYDSKTGILNDTDKPIDEAIKKVWASLWNFAAFEERNYFKIDQKSVAMGILVHQSFPDELANGVVITQNLFNKELPALTVNSQFGEISVVNPEEGYLPEQLLYHYYDNAIEYINFSNVPGKENEKVLTKEDLDELAKNCRALQTHYYELGYADPLDIEFKIVRSENNNRKVVIKQCRLYNK